MKKGGKLESWKVEKLGDVVDFQRGLTYSKKDEVDYSSNIVLRATNVDVNTNTLDFSELKYINEKVVVSKERKVRKGSLIICTASGSKSHLGKVALIDDDYDYAFGGFMGQITPRQILDSKFLFYSLTSEAYKKYIDELSDGVNINNLRFDDLANFEIPIPPLPEQQRIVSVLDEAFASISQAKSNAERNLVNARELFGSYLQETFSGSKSEKWQTKKLEDVCSLVTDGKHGDSENESNSGYYFLSAKNIKDGTLSYHDARQITKKDFEETHRRTNLMPFDICMVNTGATIGKIALAPDDPKTSRTTFQKSVAIIKPISSIIDNAFCCYHLKSDLEKLVKVSSGSAQKNLLIGDMKNHLVRVPPLAEQRAIVGRLEALSAETGRLEEIYQQKVESLEELKKSVLAKAFAGEL